MADVVEPDAAGAELAVEACVEAVVCVDDSPLLEQATVPPTSAAATAPMRAMRRPP
jgi:hypothetical protein